MLTIKQAELTYTAYAACEELSQQQTIKYNCESRTHNLQYDSLTFNPLYHTRRQQ